jgi:hypothetical protein
MNLLAHYTAFLCKVYASSYPDHILIATYKLSQMFHGIPSFSRICSCAKYQQKFEDRGTVAAVSKHNDSKYG